MSAFAQLAQKYGPRTAQSDTVPTEPGAAYQSPFARLLNGGASAQIAPDRYGILNVMSEEAQRPVWEYATELQLRPGQISREYGTMTEVRGNRELAASVGALQEHDEYLERGGPGGFTLEHLNKKMSEDFLEGTFDLLSAGNYAAAGFADELLVTGNAWEAFKQAGLEFANAMPFVDYTDEGARMMSFGETAIFDSEFFRDPESGGRYLAPVLGLAMDILFDPINLVPGALIAKSVGKGVKAADRVLKSSEIGQTVRRGFRWEADLRDMGHIGETMLELEGRNARGAEQIAMRQAATIDAMFGRFTPGERALLGMTAQQPEMMTSIINDMVRRKTLTRERADELLDFVGPNGEWTKHNRRLFEASLPKQTKGPGGGTVLRAGMFDNELATSFFLESDGRLNQYIGRVAQGKNEGADRFLTKKIWADRPLTEENLVDFAEQGLGLTPEHLARTMANVENAAGTGYDLGAATASRTFEVARHNATERLLRYVMSDPNLAHTISPWDIKGGVEKAADGTLRYFNDAEAWAAHKKEVLETYKEAHGDGYEIFEWKRPKWNAKEQDFIGEEVVGAAVMPREIAQRLTQIDMAFKQPDGLVKLLKGANDKFLSIWRGMATFTPGFHTRNATGMLFMNWLAGVGSDVTGSISQGKLPKLTDNFWLRHLQGLKLQLGNAKHVSGKMPKLPRGAEKALQRLGYESLDAVPMPRIRWPEGHPKAGELMSEDAIRRMGNQWGVAQHASKQDDIPMGDAAALLNRYEREAAGGPDALNKLLRGGADLLQWNRDVGRMVENQGRWALWLDRLAKGDGFQAARDATIKTHYDYTRLTPFERTVMRSVLPFYSWMRFNTPRMMMALVENPQKMAAVPKLQRTLENFAKTNQIHLRDSYTPDYFDEMLSAQLPFLRDEKPMFVTPDLPVNDLGRMNWQDLVSSAHPALKAFAQEVPDGGINIFTGAPLESFPGEESAELPFMSKRTQARLGTALPPINYVARILRATDRDELGVFAASELSGIRMRSVDVRRVMRGKRYQNQRLSRQYMQRLRQRLGLNDQQ